MDESIHGKNRRSSSSSSERMTIREKRNGIKMNQFNENGKMEAQSSLSSDWSESESDFKHLGANTVLNKIYITR